MPQSAAAVVKITESAPGRIAVHGALTFETARDAHGAGLRSIAAATTPEIEVDCADVAESDSAGLVVLLDWLAVGRRCNCVIRFAHLPNALLAVAAISELEALLGIGA